MRNTTFEQWTGGARESEIAEMKNSVAKKRKKYIKLLLITEASFITLLLLLMFIPLGSVGAFAYYIVLITYMFCRGGICGLVIFTGNTLNFIKTRGRNTGSGLIRTLLLCYGGIIIPIFIVQICSKNNSLGHKVCGIK